MDKNIHSFEISLPNSNEPIIFETGWKAKQANGSVWIKQGGTVVLVTAVAGKAPEAYQDFFPLTVNYIEKMYSVGKIPGGYIKRETKPSDRETLVSRLIDRPLRPLFDDGYRNETQVVATVLSADSNSLPDILALNAASAALMISDIPFSIAVGAVRIGKLNGELVVNPPAEMHGRLTMNIVVAGTKDAIAMVEAGMNGVTEDEVIEALEFAHEQIKKLVAIQEKMASEIGKPKMEYTDFSLPKDLVDTAYEKFGGAFKDAFSVQGKLESYEAIDKVKDDYLTYIAETLGEEEFEANKGIYK
ncbi:MAG: polyribonucleotide nucleotidyltransferase, partial [Mucispirillum sp.]|nr:polyribonucleotide nucleotidyltransferase [Mucispirillum sp.]